MIHPGTTSRRLHRWTNRGILPILLSTLGCQPIALGRSCRREHRFAIFDYHLLPTFDEIWCPCSFKVGADAVCHSLGSATGGIPEGCLMLAILLTAQKVRHRSPIKSTPLITVSTGFHLHRLKDVYFFSSCIYKIIHWHQPSTDESNRNSNIVPFSGCW